MTAQAEAMPLGSLLAERSHEGSPRWERCRSGRFGPITPVLSGNRSPAPAVPSQQPIGLRRTLATGLIDREPARSYVAPGVEERLHDPPPRLDPIRPLEQDRVANHAVVDEGLVAYARRSVEIVLVLERHADARNRDNRARHLRIELQTDALIRLS